MIFEVPCTKCAELLPHRDARECSRTVMRGIHSLSIFNQINSLDNLGLND